MKKLTSLMLTVVLCLGLLAGCGKDYTAEESTVFVLKNGKVVSTDVEEFGDTYDQTALETYINESIKTYNDENGKDSVKLEKLSVEEGKATLIVEYASAKDYMAFNGIELFSGSVVEALAAGYTFDVDFASITDSKATACGKDEIIDSSDLKVVVFNGKCNVNVSGTIEYASVDSTKLIDKNTIAISEEYNLLNKAAEAATETQTETETEAVAPTVEETEVADDLSVSEDDLLAESTESDEVEFDFSDEPTEDSYQTYSNVYTYIIYK